jgi:hypothetical protein
MIRRAAGVSLPVLDFFEAPRNVEEFRTDAEPAG